MKTLSHFSRQRFQLCHSKTCKKGKNCYFQRIGRFDQKLTLKLFSHDKYLIYKVLKALLWIPKYWFQCHHFNISKQTKKKVSFSNAKNVRFWPAWSFKTFQVLITKFSIWKALTWFPRECFRFATSQCGKLWKMSFSIIQNIPFWSQSSLKTIF